MCSPPCQHHKYVRIYVMSKPRLNPNQSRFVKNYIKTGNITKSAIEAGYAKKSAHVHGSRLLKNDKIRARIEETLDKMGLTDEQLAQDLKDAIKQGLTSNKATVSDALRGIEQAFRLKDKFPSTRVDINKKTLSLSLEGKTTEELEYKYQQLLEEAKQLRELEE